MDAVFTMTAADCEIGELAVVELTAVVSCAVTPANGGPALKDALLRAVIPRQSSLNLCGDIELCHVDDSRLAF